MEQYNALMRRIHNIIRFDKNGSQFYEKKNGLLTAPPKQASLDELTPVDDYDLPF
jgi:hypothetical protein